MGFVSRFTDKAQRLLIQELVRLPANSSIDTIIRLTYLAELGPKLDEYACRYNEIADRVWAEEWKGADIITPRGEGRLAHNGQASRGGKKYAYAE